MGEHIMVTDEKRLLSALGLCARARKLKIGVPMICEAMKNGGRDAPRIVFEASDNSENTRKRIFDRCEYYGIRHIFLEADGATLAAAIGKSSAVAAVAVTDDELCRLTEKYIQAVK